jgi:hypothetical protein
MSFVATAFVEKYCASAMPFKNTQKGGKILCHSFDETHK